MKASLKLREEHRNPLVRIKVPVSILGLPFVSSVTSGDPSDLSFHLRTASSAGPSLDFSYSPNLPQSPFSLSIFSGAGLFGSPDGSPLLFSAHFSLPGSPNPSFFLRIKPRVGHFSLKTTAHSNQTNPNPNPPKENGVAHLANGGDLLDWTHIRHAGGGFFSGSALTATTVLPVTKHVEVKLRWGVNIPADVGRKNLPFLTVDKIGIARVEPEKPSSSYDNPSRVSGDVKDLELLKGMCFWMGREVEDMRRENRLMKESLEKMSSGIELKSRLEVEVPVKRPPGVKGNSAEFKQWRKKQQNEGGDERQRDTKLGGLSGASGNDVEEELKKAMRAASS